MDRKSQFEMSIDTRTLYDLLMKAEIGDVVSFSEMTKALGRHVEGGEPSLQSALRHALNQDERVFGNVRKVGYKRLTDSEIVACGDVVTTQIRRKAKRGAKQLAYVNNFDSLTKDEKIKHNTYLSVLSAMTQITKTSSIKKIEGECSKTMETLPVAKTLEAFK